VTAAGSLISSAAFSTIVAARWIATTHRAATVAAVSGGDGPGGIYNARHLSSSNLGRTDVDGRVIHHQTKPRAAARTTAAPATAWRRSRNGGTVQSSIRLQPQPRFGGGTPPAATAGGGVYATAVAGSSGAPPRTTPTAAGVRRKRGRGSGRCLQPRKPHLTRS
jgi:hypothetical protein